MSIWSKIMVLAVCLGCACTVPARMAGRHARAYYEDDAQQQLALAQGVADWVAAPVDTGEFYTGHDLFDQEWVFGTYMMAAMGFGQVALAHPEAAARHSDLMADCIDQLLSERVRAFDIREWESDPLDTLATDEGHVAYLGYLDLVLGLHRKLDPNSRFAGQHDEITEALARRYERSPIGLLATYPAQIYPVDNMAAIAAIALHSEVTDTDRSALVSRLVDRVRRDYVDTDTGLLLQRVSESGVRADDPRGSGTALGAYFESWASPALARELHGALSRRLTHAPLGFGMVREYTHDFGRGDVDSGPLVAGMSIAATGFSLASARVAGDAEHFERVYRTAHLFGAPHTQGDSTSFVGGGALGNAIMLAMLTAPRGEVSR